MNSRDANIGENVARMRRGAELSQKDLAARMKEHGHRWSQATVSDVESGDRPLKLTEAEDVTLILGNPFARLTYQTPQMQVVLQNRRVFEAYNELLAAARAYRREQINLSVLAQGVEPVDRLASASDWLETDLHDVMRHALDSEEDEDAVEDMAMRRLKPTKVSDGEPAKKA